MLPECIAAVIKAAGRHVGQAELDGIEERLKSSMQSEFRKDPDAWRAMTKEQRFAAASKTARARYGEDVAAAQARTVRDMGLKARELRRNDSFKPGLVGQLTALRQRLTMQNRYGGDLALEAKIKGAYHDYTRELDGGPLKGKFWGLVQNPTEQHNLIRAIYGDKTGNPEIDSLGSHVRDVLERARQTAVDAGMAINALDNWNLPQPWAWEKIGANRDLFVRDMLAHIDPTSYVNKDGSPMTPAQLQKLVEAAAETLGTNGSNKRGEAIGSGYGGGVGASRNAPRQLHFRNADGYIHMMDTYGSANNVMSMLDHHFHGLARDTAVARSYGRDADRFVSQLIERAFANDTKAATGEKHLKKLDTLKRQTLKEYDALRNPGHPGSLPLWAQVSNTVRGVVGATLLGGSTISAIPDVQMALSYGRLLGMSKASILGNMVEGVKISKENRAFVRRLGITAQTMQEGTERFGAGELSNQAVRFMNHGVHVGSLLRMWDRSMTHGFSASLMDMLGGHVAKHDFASLDAKDRAYLTSRGVTAEHYATWQKAELETGPDNNHTMLTPDSIYAIPDEKLGPDARRLKSEAAQHLLSLTLSESQIGARGGSGNAIRDNVALHITPDNAGTIMGQMARWLLFLKQTPLGIFRTHMVDVPGQTSDWQSAWAYRARFMAGSAGLGALALTTKQILLGNDPDNLLTKKGLGEVAMASGGFGMYGDFFFGDHGDHQNNGLVKLAGPGATAISDALDLYHNTADEATGTDTPHYGSKALKFARNYAAPFTRLWYLKAAFNHTVYQQMQENLNPGYNARVNQRMQTAGQSSWWPSGQTAPERAPDLGAAIGQPANP